MFEPVHHFILPFLFSVGVIAGIVDSIAGGGGLISLPALLALGVPPHIALGTNKLQTTLGTLMATTVYYRKKLISFNMIYKGLVFGACGAMLGAFTTQIISNEILNKCIPFLLLAILIYMIFSPKIGLIDAQPKVNEFWFFIIIGFLLGFYDGFLGPGTGSLWIFFLVYFLGYNLLKATAYTKVFNLKSNVIATICFVIGHNVDYKIALFMALGQIIGGNLGARFTIKKGVAFIRPVFIIVVSSTIISLAFKNYIA